jgi:plasmid stabilization system protein ParE
MSLSYKISMAATAKADAREYAALLRDEQHSPHAARLWLEGLYAQIRSLSDYPNRFTVIPEAEELGFPYRASVYHSHRVIYAVHEEEQQVVVHRIYHSARIFKRVK